MHGALTKPLKGEFLTERRKCAFWSGRRHSPESRERMRRSALAARAAGSHDHLRKPVARELVCKQCAGQFQRKSRNRLMGKQYCSHRCQLLAMKARAIARPEKKPKTCRLCGMLFVPRWQGRAWQVFCSPKCLAMKRAERTEVVCKTCGRAVQKYKADARRRKVHFCSTDCRGKYWRGANSPMFRSESILNPYRRAQRGAWKRRADEIRQRDSHACLRCTTRWISGRAFPVDHIVPWRTFEDKALADHPSNLATLCPRCHSFKTATIERAWLKGDVLAFEKFRTALFMPTETRIGLSVTRDGR